MDFSHIFFCNPPPSHSFSSCVSNFYFLFLSFFYFLLLCISVFLPVLPLSSFYHLFMVSSSLLYFKQIGRRNMQYFLVITIKTSLSTKSPYFNQIISFFFRKASAPTHWLRADQNISRNFRINFISSGCVFPYKKADLIDKFSSGCLIISAKNK